MEKEEYNFVYFRMNGDFEAMTDFTKKEATKIYNDVKVGITKGKKMIEINTKDVGKMSFILKDIVKFYITEHGR